MCKNIYKYFTDNIPIYYKKFILIIYKTINKINNMLNTKNIIKYALELSIYIYISIFILIN